jgi:hypothetical protein
MILGFGNEVPSPAFSGRRPVREPGSVQPMIKWVARPRGLTTMRVIVFLALAFFFIVTFVLLAIPW